MRKFLLFSAVLFSTLFSAAQCENYTIQIFSYVMNGGPTSVTWEIEDLDNNNVVPGGTVMFSNFTFQQTITVCLEPGCYNLDIEANAVLSQNNFVATLMSGETILYPTNVLEYGSTSLNYNFCTSEEEPTCVACFTPSVNDGILTINNCSSPVDMENTTFTWTFGDGTNGDGPMPVHTYLDNGVYTVCVVMVVTIDNVINCVSDYCVDVVVEGLEANDCPSIIWSGPGESCSVVNFEIGSFVEGEAVNWFPGDESGMVEGGHFFSHTYEQPGLYTVCAYYTSPLCPDGVELCTNIFVEACENDCPNEIIASQIDCDSYLFQIPGTLGEVSWSFGDGTSENSGNSADHTFQEDGVYIVTAFYTSELCNEGVTIVYTVEINCNNDCPSNIVPIYNCDLGTVTLTVDGLNEDASMAWWWGNNEEFTESPSITLENSNSWIFVCAWSDSLQTEGCPEVCEEIYLGCEVDCNLNIDIIDDGCEILILSADGVPNPQNVHWSINGELYNTGSITTFYLSPGANQICAWFEGELCSDEWCETFEGCGECTEVGFSLDSFVGDGGPSLVTWSLANQNGVVLFEGMSEYNGEDPYYDQMLCLENGCYVFNVCSTEPFTAEAFDVLFSENWNVVSSESVSTFLCYGYTVLMSLNSDCEVPECTEVILGIDSYQINGGAHLINWFVFDELGNMVADGVHEYSENNSYFDTALCLPDGCYTVAIQDMTTGEFSYETLFTFATSGGLPLDISQPLVIENQYASFGFSLNGDCIVEECTDNEVTITITSSYIEAGSDMFDLTLNYENFPLELEGFFMCSECPEELSYTFCLADGCYEIDFDTEFPISAEFIMVQAFLNGIEIPEAVLEMIQGDESGSLVIGLNSDCEDSVNETEMVEWELYPNPSNDVINISMSQTQNAQLRIFDMTGKLVLETSINGYGKQIDISSLVSGVYSVVMISSETLSSKVLEVVK